MLRKILPLLMIAAGFVYFATRDRSGADARKPEDVLIEMVLALTKGDVNGFIECFAPDIQEKLRAIVQNEGEPALARRLKERGQLIKGFAILGKEQTGTQSLLLVKTETVYEDRNTAQTYRIERQPDGWKIAQTDAEWVSDWETDFGEPVWQDN